MNYITDEELDDPQDFRTIYRKLFIIALVLFLGFIFWIIIDHNQIEKRLKQQHEKEINSTLSRSLNTGKVKDKKQPGSVR